MSNENELLEPLATEAGQQAIARAINNLSSLEYAVRAERAATTATQKADEALNSANDASDYATEARNWATKTDGYVDQETITIPPEQEGDEPTTETIDLYSAKYYAALAQDIYNNLQFDTEPTENSTKLLSSGAIYTALNGKADKSTTYTKTETDTLINTKLAELVSSAPATLDTLQELATALGNDPNFATTIATQLGNKADKSDTYTKTEVDTALGNVQSTLTFDSTPTANSNNPVTSGGVYTALQNVNIDIDDEITEDSDNPVTSAAIYSALQNFTPSGDSGGAGNASGFIRDLLYENSEGLSSGTITLNKSWKDYDFIEMDYNEPTWSVTIPTYHNVNKIKSEGYISAISDKYGNHTKYFDLKIVSGSDTQLTVNGRDSFVCRRIYGIKFSKNLSEQMYSNVLYENSSGWNSGSITLNDALDNYDFISVSMRVSSDPPEYMNEGFFSTRSLLDGRYFCLTGYASRNFNASIDSTHKILTRISSNDYLIYKIVGYKMAKGGYSGIVSDARMTVKGGTYTLTESVQANVDFPLVQITFDSPMPDNNYEVLLTKHSVLTGGAELVALACNKTVNGFQIKFVQTSGTAISGNGVDWIAIRPNSYTREGMVEDVLFSNSSGVDSDTINLSGNLSDYDLIEIQYRTSNQNQNSLSSSIFTLTDFINGTRSIGCNGYSDYYRWINYVSDTSISIGSGNYYKIFKIIGIKFGRYVSGVAVDTTVTQNSNAVVTSGAVYDALQNYTPSGGGSSITVDSTITQGGTNPVEGGAIYTALGDKADKSTTYTKTEVDTAIASKGDVTTNTNQNITGTKTFVGSKKIAFKQSAANDKLGFTLYSNSNAERGYLEFNPTNTVDGVAGLMTLGNYATSAASLTQVGFRRYSNISGASGAYNLLMPMVADARTPFSLTTSYQNFYLPLGFTDGTTTVKTAKSGVVDLSPLLQAAINNISNANGVSY